MFLLSPVSPVDSTRGLRHGRVAECFVSQYDCCCWKRLADSQSNNNRTIFSFVFQPRSPRQALLGDVRLTVVTQLCPRCICSSSPAPLERMRALSR